jgi:aspartate aminotransferase-like enzyme
VQYEDFATRSQVPHTPALPLFHAADAQLERITAEGMDARWARHDDMRRLVERWVDGLCADGVGVALLAAAGVRAATVSVLRLPEGVTGPELCARVLARGFTIAPGSGALRDATVRIGHMGEHTVGTLAPCLAAVRAELREALRPAP